MFRSEQGFDETSSAMPRRASDKGFIAVGRSKKRWNFGIVRAGELAPEVVGRGYFDSIVPVGELPGLP